MMLGPHWKTHPASVPLPSPGNKQELRLLAGAAAFFALNIRLQRSISQHFVAWRMRLRLQSAASDILVI